MTTATVTSSPNHAGHARAGVALAGPDRGQVAGTSRSPLTVRAAASGTEMSSIGTGRKLPPSSNGSPGSSHAAMRIAGSAVSRASAEPAASPATCPAATCPVAAGPARRGRTRRQPRAMGASAALARPPRLRPGLATAGPVRSAVPTLSSVFVAESAAA